MSLNINQQEGAPAVSYPPPVTAYPAAGQAPYVTHPPPLGYPTKDGPAGYPQQSVPQQTTSRGEDGFWKGCCAALCCCCVLDCCL